MIKQFIKGRVYVFIDAANILYSQQTLRWRLDYKKLKEYFARECDLMAVYFYTGRVGGDEKQNTFIQKLEKLGYLVRTKEVKIIRIDKNTYEWKGNLDVELAIDVFKNLSNFDTCVLMSGDSDFSSILNEVKESKKRVLVMSTRGHISKELLNIAKYIDLRKLKDELEFKE